MKNVQLFSLPNVLTLINLFSGCLAVVFAFNYQIHLVTYCVIVSLTADFFDGFAARFTKSSSEIGKQLDSLADVISFGLVPGVVVFYMLSQLLERTSSGNALSVHLAASPAFIITLFAALRLAKFNVDARQSDGFIGLATPAATLFIIGVLEIFIRNTMGLGFIVQSVPALYGCVAVISFLMLAELPMFSFKFKNFVWKGNEVRYLFIILSVALLGVFKFASLTLIIIFYLLFSLALKLYKS